MRRNRLQEHKTNNRFVEGLVARVDEFDQDLVRPCGKLFMIEWGIASIAAEWAQK
jgi:hypothetical protein